RAALLSQRAMLQESAARARALIAAVDRALEALEGGGPLNGEQMFEAFDPARYEGEARERGGETGAYQESSRRTRRYTQEDWAAIRAEGVEITRAQASQMESGAAASSEPAMDLAERHRQHIERRFYRCSYTMHRMLGDMYVEDSRFREHYE